jgi:hypothetical protein
MLCKRHRIIRLDQESSFSMLDDLTRCTRGSSNGGQTKSHPFEIDNAKTFIARRDNEDVGLFEFFDERFFIEGAVKKDTCTCTCARCKCRCERGKMMFGNEFMYLLSLSRLGGE